MRTLVFILGISLVSVFASAVCAMAQTEPGTLKEEVQGNVRYMGGGVGLEERAAMEARAKEFNLKLVFASIPPREYLSDLPVVIKDAGGKTLLSAKPEGPWLLVKLPPGEYTVEATLGDDTKVKRVNAGKGLSTHNFLWKQ